MLRNLTKGFTTIELLIVIAILGVLMGISMIGSRQIMQKQKEMASVQQFRQLISQSTTAVNSRSINGVLVRTGNQIKVIDKDNPSKTLADMTLDSKVVTNLPSGQSLEFLPTGRISSISLQPLLDLPLKMEAAGQTFALEISVIGEVKAELVP